MMVTEKKATVSQMGQGLVEYAIILLLVVVVVIAVVESLGYAIGENYSDVNEALTGVLSEDSESAPDKFTILNDMQQRVLDFYKDNGRWPRSWGDYKFTDIGLDPADWEDAVDGIYWNPHGSNIGLANRAGDDIQIYVDDLNGNTLHLYDNWNIWYDASTSKSYYHTIDPENEVNLSTLVVVQE